MENSLEVITFKLKIWKCFKTVLLGNRSVFKDVNSVYSSLNGATYLNKMSLIHVLMILLMQHIFTGQKILKTFQANICWWLNDFQGAKVQSSESVSHYLVIVIKCIWCPGAAGLYV